jgi:hypothetical protein
VESGPRRSVPQMPQAFAVDGLCSPAPGGPAPPERDCW